MNTRLTRIDVLILFFLFLLLSSVYGAMWAFAVTGSICQADFLETAVHMLIMASVATSCVVVRKKRLLLAGFAVVAISTLIEIPTELYIETFPAPGIHPWTFLFPLVQSIGVVLVLFGLRKVFTANV